VNKKADAHMMWIIIGMILALILLGIFVYLAKEQILDRGKNIGSDDNLAKCASNPLDPDCRNIIGSNIPWTGIIKAIS